MSALASSKPLAPAFPSHSLMSPNVGINHPKQQPQVYLAAFMYDEFRLL